MIPWIERPIIYDIRARPNVITSTSGSRDLQMVRATTADERGRKTRVQVPTKGRAATK